MSSFSMSIKQMVGIGWMGVCFGVALLFFGGSGTGTTEEAVLQPVAVGLSAFLLWAVTVFIYTEVRT